MKLTDFGLAEALGTGSVAGGGGTYPYMAPEDFAAEADSDYRADLWAVGVILYEMLAGRRPFHVAKKKDPFAWKRAIDSETPEKLSKTVPGIPLALDDVLTKALAKDKTKRFQTAQAFAQTIKAVQLPQIIPAAPVVKPASVTVAVAVAPDGSPYLYFNQETVAVYTLDQLREASAKYWEEGKTRLLGGETEAFLRAIGEIYIADLAKELAARTTQSADTRLFEFIERSAPDDPPDERTVAVIKSDTDKRRGLPLLSGLAGRMRGNRFRVAPNEPASDAPPKDDRKDNQRDKEQRREEKRGKQRKETVVTPVKEVESLPVSFRVPVEVLHTTPTLPKFAGVQTDPLRADLPQEAAPAPAPPAETPAKPKAANVWWFALLLVLVCDAAGCRLYRRRASYRT